MTGWRKKQIVEMQVQRELAEQEDEQVWIPRETLEQMKTKAILEMADKMTKLEAEVTRLRTIIERYEDAE